MDRLSLVESTDLGKVFPGLAETDGDRHLASVSDDMPKIVGQSRVSRSRVSIMLGGEQGIARANC